MSAEYFEKLEQQFWIGDTCDENDLYTYGQKIKLTFSIFDNLDKVKSCIARADPATRVEVMSGFFIVDGAMIDEAQESVPFHKLCLRQQNRIALVC